MHNQEFKVENVFKDNEEVIFAIKLVTAFMVVIIIYMVMTLVSNDFTEWDKNIQDQVFFTNHEEVHESAKNFRMMHKGDSVAMKIALPMEEYVHNGTLCFYTYHCTLDVYFDGSRIDTYGHRIADRGKFLGSLYPKVLIPEDAWGKTITIYMTFTENRASNTIPPLRMYHQQNAYRFTIDRSPLALIVSGMSMVIGILLLFAMFLIPSDNPTRKKGACIALFTIDATLWLVSYYGVGLIFFNVDAWNWIEYVSLYLVLLPLVVFLLEYNMSKSSKRSLQIFGIIYLLTFIVLTILNITDIAHYSTFLRMMHIFTIVGIVIMLRAIVKIIKYDKTSKLNWILYGLLGLLIFGAADVVRYNLSQYFKFMGNYTLTSLLPLALFIFIICIGVAMIKENLDYYMEKYLMKENNTEEDFHESILLRK